MADRFEEKARDWDTRPVPAQISAGVSRAILERVELSEDHSVMDFGAGTGLVCAQLAPRVRRILAVDVSEAMLGKLREKPELADKVEAICRDVIAEPLDEKVDLVVSAMAMHHVQDTRALLRALHEHLRPGGRIALADLDAEDGSFHPPDVEGVYHQGFVREELGALLREVGFRDVEFDTACEVTKEERSYPIFLVTAKR